MLLIVDTSSIVFGLANGHDVFLSIKEHMPGYTPAVSEGILKELAGIKSRSARYGRYAGAALLIIAKDRIKTIPDWSGVDSWIYRAAKAEKCAVCTNDIALKRALKKEKIKVFSISRSGTLR